jgi:type I restriction enzyme, S subunit
MKNGWQKKALGAVCELVNGGTPKTGVPEYWDGSHLWITPAEMGKRLSPYVGETERLITDLGLRDSSAQMLPPNSVILSSRAPIGHLVINTEPMATNQGCKGLIPGSQLQHKFLYYYLSSIVDVLNALGTGATFKELSGGKLKEVTVPVAPLPEQRRIVGILDEAFAGIAIAKANAEKNLQNARALFESHLQSVFARRGKGWVEATIGEVCDIKHGLAFDGADFSNDVPEGNPLVITPGNFTEDGKLLFNEKNSKRFSGDTTAGFQFDVGDLVVVMTDLSSKMKILGKPAFVETDNVLHNQRIGRVVFLNDRLEKRLLYYFMMTDGFLKNIKGSATGTMVKHTAPKRILSNPIPFPENRKEQRAIITQLDDLREETQHLASIYERKLAGLDALKKSLLHQAFTGQL